MTMRDIGLSEISDIGGYAGAAAAVAAGQADAVRCLGVFGTWRPEPEEAVMADPERERHGPLELHRGDAPGLADCSAGVPVEPFRPWRLRDRREPYAEVHIAVLSALAPDDGSGQYLVSAELLRADWPGTFLAAFNMLAVADINGRAAGDCQRAGARAEDPDLVAGGEARRHRERVRGGSRRERDRRA